jgi:hypothetical protein
MGRYLAVELRQQPDFASSSFTAKPRALARAASGIR